MSLLAQYVFTSKKFNVIGVSCLARILLQQNLILIIFAIKDKIMLSKTIVQKSIDRLPQEFSIDELIEQLIFIQQVEEGLQQSREGKVISHEDVKSMFARWSK